MSATSTIVVLGAGINGAAIARELAVAGAEVIVVDSGDIASGTTAWSTRLIHGGLRYLEYGEIGLVRESLAERDRLVRLAPHLVRPLPFYLPVEGRWGGLRAAAARLAGFESLARAWQGPHGRGSWTVAAGLTLYDLLATGDGWPRHRMVRAGAAGLPAVDRGTFPLAATYADAQLLFPERFTVELLVDARRIAAAAGSRFDVCTHREAAFTADGTLSVAARGDAGRRREPAIEVRPDAVVNATGAWVDRTLAGMVTGHGGWSGATGKPLIAGTKGSHLLVRSVALRNALCGYGVYCEAADGRPVFVLPFGAETVLVGTTDIPFSGDPDTARADDAEIDYLLAAVVRLFPGAGVRRDEVQQHYCGVRPLPNVAAGAGRGGPPAGITRRHLLVRHAGTPVPLWSVVGGKLTTCRSLAETTAATVLAALGRPVRATTRERPLPGHCDGAARDGIVRRCRDLAVEHGLSATVAADAATRAVDLFGARAVEIWRAPPGPGCTRADHASPGGVIRGVGLPTDAVGMCLRDEWAVTLDDVVERRLMLSFHEQLSREAIEDVAAAMVRAGALQPHEQDTAVAACLSRLASRYGRTLPSVAAAPAAATMPGARQEPLR